MVKVKPLPVMSPAYDSSQRGLRTAVKERFKEMSLIGSYSNRFPNSTRQPNKIDRSNIHRVKLVIVNVCFRSFNIKSALAQPDTIFDVFNNFMVRRVFKIMFIWG